MCCGCNLPSASCSWRRGRTMWASANSDQWASVGETLGKMFQCSFPVLPTSILFEDKIKFSASKDLALARRKWLKPSDRVNLCHVLGFRPPDFSIRLLKCLKVPQSRDEKMLSNSSKPWQIKGSQTAVPTDSKSWNLKEEPRKFITLDRPPDTLEIELRFVLNGKYSYLQELKTTWLQTWKAKASHIIPLTWGVLFFNVKFDRKVAVTEKVYNLLHLEDDQPRFCLYIWRPWNSEIEFKEFGLK